MEKIKVSILVPVYNVDKYIERCAVSLFEQTYANIEYIFVNDCTPDNSIERLQAVLKKYPKRIKQVKIISHLKNSGIAVVRNTAINNATGEFVLWVDSDDYIDVRTLELVVQKQQEMNSDIVNFDVVVYRPSYREYYYAPIVSSSKDFTLMLIKRICIVSVWGRLIRRSLYVDNEVVFVEGINMGEDYLVSCKIAYYSKRISSLNKILYHYDCTNENSSTYAFSKKNFYQTHKAVDCLYCFFKDKGMDYLEAVLQSKMILLYGQLKGAMSDNKNHYNYENRTRKMIDKMDEKYIKYIPITLRALYWIRIHAVGHFYIKFAGFVKHLCIFRK